MVLTRKPSPAVCLPGAGHAGRVPAAAGGLPWWVQAAAALQPPDCGYSCSCDLLLLHSHLNSPPVPSTLSELPARACIVADLLLAEHLELLFGQHVSVAIACAIYYTVRLCPWFTGQRLLVRRVGAEVVHDSLIPGSGLHRLEP